MNLSDSGFCSGNLCYKMDTGVVLPIGSSLVSANGKYQLKMQPDKNLVLYCYAGNPIWHASTYGKLLGIRVLVGFDKFTLK